MMLNGNTRSNPADVTRLCGYWKFGSFRLMVFVPAWPGAGAGDPAQALGWLFTSAVNTGVRVPVQESRTRPRPVFCSALATRMNGGGPVNTPTLPRSWFV